MAPLSSAVLETYKRQIATAFHRVGGASTAGLTGPLTLGISSWNATVGSATGSLYVRQVDSTGYSEPIYLVSAPYTGAPGSIELQYAGLTAGGLYMIDCTAPGMGGFALDISGANGPTQTTPSLTVGDDFHAVLGFQSSSSDLDIMIYNALPLDPQTDGGGHQLPTQMELDSCTLYPVG